MSANFATTADMYAHLMTDSQAKATDKLGQLLADTKPKKMPEKPGT